MKRLAVSFSWRDKSLQDIVSCGRLAEEVGLETVWISEAWGRDAFLALAAVAASTHRIKLGTGIVNVYSRSPATIAMAITTLDELSNGRAILGLGSSGAAVVERWHGLHYQRPLTRLHETITIVRQILSGNTVNLQGRIFQVSDFQLAVQPPTHTIPIYLAALGPKMLRLAGSIADGVLLYLCPMSKIAYAIAHVREGANLAGRPSASVDVAAFLPTFVSENREEARRNVAASVAYYVGGMGTYYHRLLTESGFEAEANRIRDAWQRGDRVSATKQVTDQIVGSVALAGTPNECRSRLEEFRRAGVDLPILSFYIPDEKALQTVRESIRSLTELPNGKVTSM
jgi:F420-dependent oxidoreductase-like protein